MGEVGDEDAWREGVEETDEETELAWQAAIMAQMQADGVDPGDEDAERAWLEALAQQQGMTMMEEEEDDEDIDEFEEAYYEELYKNTRMNEGDITQGESIDALNEQKWALMNSKKQYEEHLQRHSLNAIAMQALLADLPKLPKNSSPSTAPSAAPPSNSPRPKGAPVKGILRNKLSRVDIDNRMTLRMRKSPVLLQMEMEAAGRPKKNVNFYLTDEQAEKQRIKQALDEAEANSTLDEQAFLNMSLQFIDDYNREELMLQQERERLEAMEAQILALEAEIAAGESNNNNDDNNNSEDERAPPAQPNQPQQRSAPPKATPPAVPSGRPTPPPKPQQPPRPQQPVKPPHHQPPMPQRQQNQQQNQQQQQNHAQNAPQEQQQAEQDGGLSTLQMRAKRGTKGFGGVFLSEVHRLLEEDEKKKAEEDKQRKENPARQATSPRGGGGGGGTSPRGAGAASGASSSPRGPSQQQQQQQQQKGSSPAPKASRAPAHPPSSVAARRGTGPSSTSPPKQAPSTPQKGPVAAAAASGGPASAKKYYSPPPQRAPPGGGGRGGTSPSVALINRAALQQGAESDKKRVEENRLKDLDTRRKVQEATAMRMRKNKEKMEEEAQRRRQAIQEAADLKNAIPKQRAPVSPQPAKEEDPLEGRKHVSNLRSMFSARIQEEESEVVRMKQKLMASTSVSEDAKFRDERMKRLEMMRNQILAKKEGGSSPRKVSG